MTVNQPRLVHKRTLVKELGDVPSFGSLSTLDLGVEPLLQPPQIENGQVYLYANPTGDVEVWVSVSNVWYPAELTGISISSITGVAWDSYTKGYADGVPI